MADIDFNALDDLVIYPSERDPEMDEMTRVWIEEYKRTGSAEEASALVDRTMDERRRAKADQPRRESA